MKPKSAIVNEDKKEAQKLAQVKRMYELQCANEELNAAKNAIEEKYNVVFGFRFPGGIEYAAAEPQQKASSNGHQ